MFVSSYATYIQPDNSSKNFKQTNKHSDVSSSEFYSKVLDSKKQVATKSTIAPIDYTAKRNILDTKQQMQDQQELKKFSSKKILANATDAYINGSKFVSSVKIPNLALNLTPSIEKTLPKEPKAMKEMILRHKMINTYIANDNYYKITA